MATFDQRDQIMTTQYNADRVYIYAQATFRPVDPETLAVAERQLAALPLETIPDPAPLPPGSRMPLRRNPLFVGREADLRALVTALKGGETTAIGQTAAASGLGGIGKTQLASEFVHRYGQFFAGGVFWLNFADPAAVATEVAACGGRGALALHPEFHTLPLTDQVQLVHAAWQSRGPAKKSVKFQIIIYKLLISCKISQSGFQTLHRTLKGDSRYQYRKINSFTIQVPFFMIKLIVSKR